MKKLITTIIYIASFSATIAQNNTLEQSISEIRLKITNTQKGEKLKWLDSLSKITQFKTEFQYESIVRETISLAKTLDSANLILLHTSNLINFQNNTLQKPNVAIQIFENYIPKIENLPNALYLAEFYFYGGDSYYDNKNYAKSIEYINKALLIFEKLNNTTQISNCNFKLGTNYNKISDYDKSLSYFFNSLKIDEKNGNDNGVAVNLTNIGEIYLLTGDFKNAQLNFNRALEIYYKINDKKGIVFNLTNLGASYQKNNELNKAIDIFKKAIPKAVEINLERSQSILLGNIGSSLSGQGKYDESLEYLFEALTIKLKIEIYGSAAYTCNNIAETYLKMKRYKEAKTYALKAIDLANGVNLNNQKYAYYLASESTSKLGDFKASYSFLKMYNKLQDSIFSIQKTASIDEMQIKYETEKQDHKIKEQESNIALLDAQNKVKDQWMLFGGAGLFSVFAFVLLIRSKNKAKQRKQLQEKFSQDLLQSQEEERNRIAKELHDSIGQQLTFIKKKSQSKNQEEISLLTNNALEEVRSISRGLFPAVLKQLGLSDSIEQLIYDVDEKTDIFISTEIEDINDLLNESETLNYYRFIQECVTNIVKHANAKTISVNIKIEKKTIFTLISDNGIGFDINKIKQNSLGLKTISERIKILKGTLSIDSKLGRGTIIKAEIPVK